MKHGLLPFVFLLLLLLLLLLHVLGCRLGLLPAKGTTDTRLL